MTQTALEPDYGFNPQELELAQGELKVALAFELEWAAKTQGTVVASGSPSRINRAWLVLATLVNGGLCSPDLDALQLTAK